MSQEEGLDIRDEKVTAFRMFPPDGDGI